MNLKHPQEKSVSFYELSHGLPAKMLSLGAFGIGLAVIGGWLTQNSLLIQLSPKLVPMQFNTALCFLLAGLGLFFYPRGKFLSLCFGFLCFCIAFSTGLQYIFGVELGIDELFIDHYITTLSSHPGRMAPNTAMCFTLSGLYLLLANLLKSREMKFRIAWGLGTLIFSLSFVAISGYFFSISSLYGWKNLTDMAPHTAIGFLLVSTGICSIVFQSNRPLLIVTLCVGGVFLVDLLLPLGFAAGSLYVVPIILASYVFQERKEIVSLSLLCGALTLLAAFTSPWIHHLGSTTILGNRAVSLFSIAVVAWISSQRMRSIKSLRESQNELKRSNEELSRFAYVASHDLQAPLRHIATYAGILTEEMGENENKDVRMSVEKINTSISRMRALIQGLLDFSRVGQGKLDIKPVNVGKIVKDLQEMMEPQLREVEAEIVLFENSVPSILADQQKTFQLFQNLISNALKFQKTNSAPRVEIESFDRGNFWEFVVRDNGIGMNPEFFEKIFQMFQRLHQRSEFSGTGIGLSICKKIVELHGGEIWVSSEEGKGSEFHFTIAKNLEIKNAS